MRYTNRNKQKIKVPTAVVVLLAAVFCALFLWDMFLGGGTEPIGAECEFHFIDVGQGDCTMIITNDTTVVVDAGTTDHADSTLKYIKNYTDRIDYFIITHPHEDHIGGAGKLVENIKTDCILMTDAASETYTFTSLLDKIENSNADVINAAAGDVYYAGDLVITVLAPLHEFDNFNNYSMVVNVTYKNVSALITGDAEKDSENEMLERWSDKMLNADIIKLSHHGSSTSTGKKFLAAVDPQWAVISCGASNSYGHPHEVTLELLDTLGVPYVRTDEMGTVIFRTDGEKVTAFD